jgi:hypothetical protein
MKKYQHLRYQTYIMRTTLKYIFMMYGLDIVRINIFVFVRSQTLESLTLIKNYNQHILGRMEYHTIMGPCK